MRLSFGRRGNHLSKASVGSIVAPFIVISIVALVTFYPIIAIGLFAEDYVAVDMAARLNFPNYLSSTFDQCVSAGFCRPAQGLGIWIEYALWGNNITAYRLVEILIHTGNCLLLYILSKKITQRETLALMTALIYCGIPVMSSAFYWFNISDQAAGFFYLGALFFWLKYLKGGSRTDYLLAIGAFILSLLNKEIGITVPITLFLLEHWVIQAKTDWRTLFRRYLPLGLVWFIYGLFLIPRLASFTKSDYGGSYAGLNFGGSVFSNLEQYLSAFILPWQTNQPEIPMGLLWVVILMVAYIVLFRRNSYLAFLMATTLLPLLPVLTFNFAASRYLYLSFMPISILLAICFEGIYRWTALRWRWLSFSLVGLTSVLIIRNSFVNSEAFDAMAAFAREYRSPIRSLFQRHPVFANGTSLYLINSPVQTGIVSGMVAMRYGPSVLVAGSDTQVPNGLNRRGSSFVFYFDDKNQIIEQSVEPSSNLQIIPELPANFSLPLRLEELEISKAQLKSGDALIGLLHWRSTAKIPKDYTVFAHLVDTRGETVASSDSQPHDGKLPTSLWSPGKPVVDWVIIPITDQVPIGKDYRLEIGLYYAPTLERVNVFDSSGHETDKIVVQWFDVN